METKRNIFKTFENSFKLDYRREKLGSQTQPKSFAEKIKHLPSAIKNLLSYHWNKSSHLKEANKQLQTQYLTKLKKIDFQKIKTGDGDTLFADINVEGIKHQINLNFIKTDNNNIEIEINGTYFEQDYNKFIKMLGGEYQKPIETKKIIPTLSSKISRVEPQDIIPKFQGLVNDNPLIANYFPVHNQDDPKRKSFNTSYNYVMNNKEILLQQGLTHEEIQKLQQDGAKLLKRQKQTS